MANSVTASTNAHLDLIRNSVQKALTGILRAYPGDASSPPPRLSQEQIDRISQLLVQADKPTWSKIPRIYAVLHMIDQLRYIDAFIGESISDLWLPFAIRTLPVDFRSAEGQYAFIEHQRFVLTGALELEREDGRHKHFSKTDDLPFVKLAELGHGGYGSVDRVLSKITHKEYARKLMRRGKTFGKDREALRDFEKELGNLKKVQHHHIVKFVGSYTVPNYVGILMIPVADGNLAEFLADKTLTISQKSLLRTFYGCLAVAVQYLHENRIRHKDIKPQNILVKGHQVFLTDFGLSLDWSEYGRSTTSGPNTGRTPRYCAPEVGHDLRRNTLADIWSLGCVYLEMWTVFKGETITNLTQHLERFGAGSSCYYRNIHGITAWTHSLIAKSHASHEDEPLSWINGALEYEQDQRWTAKKLVTSIIDTNTTHDVLFMGNCCAHDDDRSTPSAQASKRSSYILDETGVSSIGVYEPNPNEILRREQVGVDVEDQINASKPTSAVPIDISDNGSNPNTLQATLKQSTLLDTTQETTQSLRHLATVQQKAENRNSAHSDTNLPLDSVSQTRDLMTSEFDHHHKDNSNLTPENSSVIEELEDFERSDINRTDDDLMSVTQQANSQTPWEASSPIHAHQSSESGPSQSLKLSGITTQLRSHSEEKGGSNQAGRRLHPVLSVDDYSGMSSESMESLVEPTTVEPNPSSVGLTTESTSFTSSPVAVSRVDIASQKVAESAAAAHIIQNITSQKPINLKGHRGLVTSVAFSPDGKLLASGSSDKTVRIWDVETRQVRHVSKHSNSVLSVTFSPDNEFVASGSYDGTIGIWHIKTPQSHVLSGHLNSVYSVSYSPDGKLLASASRDCSIRIWDTNTRQTSFICSDHTDCVFTVTFSPNGRLLASGSVDETICIWDVSTRRILYTLSGHKFQVRSVVFSPDGKQLASASLDGIIKIWDMSSQQTLYTLSNQQVDLWSVDFSPDAKLLASCSMDGPIRIWDMDAQLCLHQLSAGSIGVSSVKFSPDGRLLASGHGIGRVRLWGVGEQHVVREKGLFRLIKKAFQGM